METAPLLVLSPSLMRMTTTSDPDWGHVYLLSHPAHHPWLKVGRTVNLKQRLGTYQTADPNRSYAFIRTAFVPDYRAKEQNLIERLKALGWPVDHEWIKAPVAEVLKEFERIIN